MKTLIRLIALSIALITASAADFPTATTSVIAKYSGPTKNFGRFGSITTNDVIELTRTEANAIVGDSDFSVSKINGVGNSILATELTYSGGTNLIVDLSANTLFYATLTNTAYISFTNVTANESGFILHLKQDATGARSVTWAGNFKFASGTAPTITTNAAAVDQIRFTRSSFVSTNFYGQVTQDLR
jgi:hypothetical protein